MLINIEFYPSAQQRSIIRRYQKFSEILASLGGTAKALMVIGFILVKNQATLNLMRIIMTKLYYFPLLEEKSKNKKKNNDNNNYSSASTGIKHSTRAKFHDIYNIMPERKMRFE